MLQVNPEYAKKAKKFWKNKSKKSKKAKKAKKEDKIEAQVIPIITLDQALQQGMTPGDITTLANSIERRAKGVYIDEATGKPWRDFEQDGIRGYYLGLQNAVGDLRRLGAELRRVLKAEGLLGVRPPVPYNVGIPLEELSAWSDELS